MSLIDFATLSKLAATSAGITQPCSCCTVPLAAWQRLPTSLELDRFEEVGTLVADAYDEPSFKEYHPHGTRDDSPDAPIAPRYYPANRSQVARCMNCGRYYLRYNEAGGYFTDLRIRAHCSLHVLVDRRVGFPSHARCPARHRSRTRPPACSPVPVNGPSGAR